MKTKIFLIVFLIFSARLFAQQNEGAKLQKADESGFIEVDKAPKLISQLSPVYPELAKLAGIEGTVYLKLLIDEKGNVAKARVEQGVNDMLDNSALAAAKKAKFYPATIKDKPVKVWVVLPIAFKLSVDKTQSPEAKASNTDSEEPDINAFQEMEIYPEMIEAVTPDYPELAKTSKITGKVFVKLLVDKSGNPKRAVVIKSDSELLNQPAVDAAMKSKFTPAMQGGKAIAVWIVLPYKFLLGEPEKGESELFETVEQARENFIQWKSGYEMSELDVEKMTGKKIKFEKLDENISFGDESDVYKGTSNNKAFYSFLARNGIKVYKYNAASLDEIKKYVDELKKKDETKKKFEEN